jgi:hypothetical protein
LLRLRGRAKRKEQGAKRQAKDFSIHDFSSVVLICCSRVLNHIIRPCQYIRRNLTILDFGLAILDFGSSDDAIGSDEHIRWNGQSDLFGRFEIDHQLELGRLLDRQIGRLGAL